MTTSKKIQSLNKYLPTLFLKAVILVMAVIMGAWTIFAVPTIARDAFVFIPDFKFLVYLFMVGMYGALLPYYFALFNGFRFLSLVEKRKAFAPESLKSLRQINLSSSLVSIFYLLFTMPFFYAVAEKDDAPGLILVGAAFGAAPLVFAALAQILSNIFEGKKDE